MTEPRIQPDVFDLISRYINGELDVNDAARLLERLEAEPSLDETLYANLFVDFLIKKGVQSDHAAMRLPCFGTDDAFYADLVRMEKDAPSLRTHDETPPENPRKPWVRPRWLPSVQGVLACVLLFLFCGVLVESYKMSRIDTAGRFSPIARIVETIDARWEDSYGRFKAGEEIGPDKLVLRSGLVQVEFFSGARVVLEGPVEFILNDRNRSFCQRGKLSAHVPPQARGFEVTTPFSTIVDLGTEFSMEVTDTAAEVHVFTGSVEVNRLAASVLKLTEGLAARMTYKGETERKEADPSVFLNENKILEMKRLRDSRDLEAWSAGRDRRRHDTALLLDIDFEGERNVRLLGATLSTGRWAGKRGVEFRRKNDAVLLDVPDSLDSLTMFISVRVDSSVKYNQVLLASRTVHDGDLTWQLRSDGAVQLLMHENEQNPPLQFTSPPVLGWGTRGVWLTFAVVIDHEKHSISHYLDGRPIATLPWRSTFPIRLGEATLGNALVQGRRPTDRSLDGCIDQFLLFNRALSAQEIERLHDIPYSNHPFSDKETEP